MIGKNLKDACVYCGIVDMTGYTVPYCNKSSTERDIVVREAGKNLNGNNNKGNDKK